VARFDRAEAPAGPARNSDAALEWGAYHALSQHKAALSVGALVDKGAFGVEGGICLWAAEPSELVRLVSRVLKKVK
jgi:hydroxymethylpyrimidine/phosphomethylpyrimidine kinase